MFLIAGASGNVGSELVRALAGEGARVRALTRSGQQAELPRGVEAVAGDLNEPRSLATALAGVQAAFLLPGYGDMPGVLAAARESGVERVIQLSGASAASGDMSNAITAYMVRSESAVKDSGLLWTILRPTAFMANALRWLPQLSDGNVIRAPFADVRTAAVDPFDIAAVAAEALRNHGHEGRTYQPTGPESLLPADQVRILAQVLGRDLRFEAQPDEEARAEMAKSTPAEYIDAFFDFYVTGTLDESQVRTTVKDVTGSEPRSFEQWATAHADAFR